MFNTYRMFTEEALVAKAGAFSVIEQSIGIYPAPVYLVEDAFERLIHNID